MRGFFQPVAAAKGFGLELLDARDDVFVRIKAGRDLGTGLMLLVPLWLRERRVVGWTVIVSSVMPVVDGTIVATSARGSVPYALMVHGSAVIYGLVVGPLLLRAARPVVDHSAAMATS